MKNVVRFGAVALLASTVLAQPESEEAKRCRRSWSTRAHYTKYEYKIPMRDEAKLFVAVYAPKDQTQRYPILMIRTPYSVEPYGVDNYKNVVGPSEPAERMAHSCMVTCDFVFYLRGISSTCGRHKTHFSIDHIIDDGMDGYDTIDWLVKNVPNNNGRVGMWGISYPGHYAAHALIDSHPALKAVSPQAPMGDVGDRTMRTANLRVLPGRELNFCTSFFPRKPDPERPHQEPEFDAGTSDAYDYFLRMEIFGER